MVEKGDIRRNLRRYSLTSSFCICSRDLFFVSGNFHANTMLRALITAKMQKMRPPPELPVPRKTGKVHVKRADQNQWVMLPSTCPLPRTLFGKTSAMTTQMQAHKETAKKAMKTITQTSSR